MRAIRRFYQVFFLLLFCVLVYLTAQGSLRAYTVTLLLDSSAFNGLATLLASWNVAHTMWVGFAVLALTFVFGRFFCGWICPMGTILHACSWLAAPRSTKARIERNTYSRSQAVKYGMLVVLLVAAALGGLQAGLFDPIALLTRSSAVVLAPGIAGIRDIVAYGVPARVFPTGGLIAVVFGGILLLNLYWPRYWCRVLCPLGALLGTASRFVPGGVVRDEVKCTNCGLCQRDCPGACSPHTTTRMAECFVCWNCIEDCPEDALRWQWFAPRTKTIAAPDITRRALLTSAAGGVAGLVALRLGGATYHRGHTLRIRPPGALAEEEFLKRCIKCGKCMKVCPTNVIQPALSEAGFEGVWTPVMNMTTGYCELNCTLCGQVCSTGAIERLTIAEKRGLPDSTPVKIGTAFVDRSRCIPWSLGRDCLVCQEVCPVSPKAIYDIEGTGVQNGAEVMLRRPQVDPAKCIGCGLCQHECPVHDTPAIRVTSAGESRSPGGGFYL